MTDDDLEEVLARIGALFDAAGPEGGDAVAGALGSTAHTAILLSRGYEPGYIPELDGLLAAAGETAPEPEEEEYDEEPEESPEEAPAAEEPAPPEPESLWDDLPAFELPDVAADGFVLAGGAPIRDDAGPEPEEPTAEEEEEPAGPAEPEPAEEEEPAPAPEEEPPAEDEEPEPEEAAEPEEDPDVGMPAPVVEEPPAGVPEEPGEEEELYDEEPEEGPRLVAHEVPDHVLPEDLTPVVRALPPRYMPLWVGIPLFLIAVVCLGVPLAAVVLVLFAVLLVPGPLLLIAAWLVFVGGLWCVAYIADAVMLFGAAFIVLGLGLMVLWLCLWLGVSMVKLYIRGVRGLGRVCLGRKEAGRYA